MKILALLCALSLSASAADIVITFTVPDAKAAAIIDDLAAAKGYQPQILKDKATSSETTPNPETKLAFLKRLIGEDLIATLANYRANRDAVAAEEASMAATAEAAKAVTVK